MEAFRGGSYFAYTIALITLLFYVALPFADSGIAYSDPPCQIFLAISGSAFVAGLVFTIQFFYERGRVLKEVAQQFRMINNWFGIIQHIISEHRNSMSRCETLIDDSQIPIAITNAIETTAQIFETDSVVFFSQYEGILRNCSETIFNYPFWCENENPTVTDCKVSLFHTTAAIYTRLTFLKARVQGAVNRIGRGESASSVQEWLEERFQRTIGELDTYANNFQRHFSSFFNLYSHLRRDDDPT